MDVALSASVSLPRRPEWRCVWNHLLGRVEQPDPPVAVVLLGAGRRRWRGPARDRDPARTIAARFGLTLGVIRRNLGRLLVVVAPPRPL